ncbi:YveK family protein [Carnobacterium divergens]|uniref:Capsular polysaccharide biosynthesis protein CpsC n=2 Tax=Carnobacterium divergens TaxID=2748 RepID=A0A0R2I4C3_CARDV|nr:Wzz/FepE/Etk N-terminal domain-containing protein [Carnobacterium divergens]KRN57020.1 hypothetical protein IV74_GL000670 [Carnobacterium divergens DSM 20623]MDO0874757.1 Wzz/FepE/Etk N-terminal domain-containing protein [Carnobacterium divergens]MDT1959339.1 Wzz/FepE/Etk N-terminal domain-containing protein [Carnobacterium divergens]MDT1975306.1 Wzz/FepE/Etk N-terminal domain-containing protein [Carnobacterium divergens]SUX16110.1 Capsular polysaccharide type 8 biosynthesis protein cap8A [
MEEIIDLKKILTTIKQNKWWLIGTIVFSLSMMSMYLWFIATPVYQSSTQLLINQTEEKDSILQQQSVQTNLDLINTYNVIIKSPRILDKVKKELKNAYSEKELNESIQVSSATNSQIIDIKVENSSKKATVDIANTTARIFQKEIVSIMKINNVTILSTAKLEKTSKPISPNKTMLMVVALIGGGVIGLILIIMRSLLDRTIKGKEDIEMLNITVLGSIGELPEEI